MTAPGIPAAVTAEQLQEAAEQEAAGCTVEGGPYWSSERECNKFRSWYSSERPAVKRCARPGCPHHLHRWARVDARYCSGTCRMAVLRAARKEAAT